jgi:hypothetical protein
MLSSAIIEEINLLDVYVSSTELVQRSGFKGNFPHNISASCFA